MRRLEVEAAFFLRDAASLFRFPSAAKLVLDEAIDPLLRVEGIVRAIITHVLWVEEIIASPRRSPGAPP